MLNYIEPCPGYCQFRTWSVHSLHIKWLSLICTRFYVFGMCRKPNQIVFKVCSFRLYYIYIYIFSIYTGRVFAFKCVLLAVLLLWYISMVQRTQLGQSSGYIMPLHCVQYILIQGIFITPMWGKNDELFELRIVDKMFSQLAKVMNYLNVLIMKSFDLFLPLWREGWFLHS